MFFISFSFLFFFREERFFFVFLFVLDAFIVGRGRLFFVERSLVIEFGVGEIEYLGLSFRELNLSFLFVCFLLVSWLCWY